ncbi:MAG: DUF3570 domain-containing protein [Deltaproteobacteria bacterium]|nr:DUF3570 domain-containing protein [Deltaproteobacteria bacterium]
MAATELLTLLLLSAPRPVGSEADTEAPEAQLAPPSGTRVASRVAVYDDDDGLTVVTPIVSFEQRIFDATELGVEYDADILSAATVDVRTSATQQFKEVRHGVAVSGAQRVASLETELSGAVAYSHEADYRSITLGGGFSSELLEKNLTVGLGYSFVSNDVGRSGTPFSNFSESSRIHAFSFSITQLLSKRSYLQLSGSVIGSYGYQASVYRYVPVFLEGTVDPAKVNETTLLDGSVVPVMRPAERLPQDRLRAAGVVRLNQGFATDTSVSADYRFYGDGWGVQSHTIGLAVYQHLPAGLVLRGRNRLYLQSAADFYQDVAMVGAAGELPELYTSDRELGTFWYDMAGLKLILELGKGELFERVTIDVALDVQFTRYSDFVYLETRTAWIGSSGLSFEL